VVRGGSFNNTQDNARVAFRNRNHPNNRNTNSLNGIPWLGFVVYPTHRRVKGRKVRYARRHLHQRLEALHRGDITFDEFNASVQGWINHVGHADSWRLREAILSDIAIAADALRRQ